MTASRLSLATLARLPPDVARPGYDPAAIELGISRATLINKIKRYSITS